MQQWQIEAQNGQQSLNLVDVPKPEVAAGQVLLRMKAAALNYRDLLMVKGKYGGAQSLPLVPLSDGVGEVIAVGAGVDRVQMGDRVATIFMQRWIDGGFSNEKSQSALGGALPGVLAEYVVLDQAGVVKVPVHLSDEAAATLPCAAVTAWHALVSTGKVKAGDTVLLIGTGGVSIFALQFAKLLGARVIITSSSDAKLAKAKELGANELINYRTNPDWEQQVWELTNKAGVDHVVEVGGAGTLNKSLRSVRMGGRISLIGVLAGISGEVNTVAILSKAITIQGIYVGSRTMFEDMNRAIDLHKLNPIVDRVFGFAQAEEAFSYLESGGHFGKIAIRF
ncbi:NADPH:quinone reductase [Thalassoporum mexicanum PCC 7367]|uniref:zinc-dependent alcohol dehydrogenase family protein n=1 Tax=Thalassoporum mexicanum TaxID=3457544 RepID=UPI00029FBAEE|nr:NAD(P)-dependent alcohol dehydrogenase [Pseudanabaena sp. PCC 7367]AFY68877.1 NADPH:quinone reductase [Pseudanabaena sp. PCC 7367]